jgi:hypothetical protein
MPAPAVVCEAMLVEIAVFGAPTVAVEVTFLALT